MFNLFFSVDAKRNDSELIKRIEKEGQQDIHQKDKSSLYVLGYGRPSQNQYIPPIPAIEIGILVPAIKKKGNRVYTFRWGLAMIIHIAPPTMGREIGANRK
ncbi:hypothetical protein RIR_jg1666.t1 [Rhizophagus irregularis DAOM 181602=DAOM 197198]|nr:hypothetical protein RIR_jg1666.t1 [Rhizophagus irregularis DAOM 181602=DAOM 197198]